MVPARTPASTFSSETFSDLEGQGRRLAALLPGALVLELTPVFGKCIVGGVEPWVFAFGSEGDPEAVAAGLVREGRIARSLHVAIAGRVPGAKGFWDGLREFAKQKRASTVTIECFGADQPPIPRLSGEQERDTVPIFLIELQDHDLDACLSKNHKRNIRKAAKQGAEILQRNDAPAVREHLRLSRSSLDRKSELGENIGSLPQIATFEGYRKSGYATYFQAGISGRILASDLVVRVGDAAFYVSGGTDPEGMKLGVSHFLMFEVIERLRESGCRTLNLGYTINEGVARFKLGFGARSLPVERVRLDWGSPLQRILKLALRGRR